MYEEDRLEEEYKKNFIFDEQKMQCLKDIGIVLNTVTHVCALHLCF